MVDDEPPFTHHLKVRPYRGIEKALDRHNELLATIAAQAAELEALRGEVEPVRHWYESDEHSPRSDVEVLKDIVADLQSDRAENLKLRARVAALEEGLRDFCLSAECAAGVDEGASEDVAESEIMSFAGSALAVSYSKARALLNHNGEA